MRRKLALELGIEVSSRLSSWAGLGFILPGGKSWRENGGYFSQSERGWRKKEIDALGKECSQ